MNSVVNMHDQPVSCEVLNVKPEMKFTTGNYELMSGMEFPSKYANPM
jgi:hypothetical protein